MLHYFRDVVLDGGTKYSSGPVLPGVQEVLRLQECRLVPHFRVKQISQRERVSQVVPLVQWFQMELPGKPALPLVEVFLFNRPLFAMVAL